MGSMGSRRRPAARRAEEVMAAPERCAFCVVHGSGPLCTGADTAGGNECGPISHHKVQQAGVCDACLLLHCADELQRLLQGLEQHIRAVRLCEVGQVGEEEGERDCRVGVERLHRVVCCITEPLQQLATDGGEPTYDAVVHEHVPATHQR